MTTLRWTSRRKLLVAALIGAISFVVLLLSPTRNSSTLTLVMDSDSRGSVLEGLSLGGMPSLIGGVGISSGASRDLYRVKDIARSEWAFTELLKRIDDLNDEFELRQATAREDTVEAYASYRRSHVSTRVDADGQVLELRFAASSAGLARTCVTELGNLIVSRLGRIRKTQSEVRVQFLADRIEEAELMLVANEDSLVNLMEDNRLGLSTPRVQQQIERVRRRIDIWSATVQRLRVDEIRVATQAASDIPEVYSILPATSYDNEEGMGLIPITLLSLLAGLGVFVLLRVVERSPG